MLNWLKRDIKTYRTLPKSHKILLATVITLCALCSSAMATSDVRIVGPVSVKPVVGSTTTVSVSNFPAIQPVSGTVTVQNTTSTALSVSLRGVVSDYNTTTSTLPAGGVFTGTGESVKDYASITITVHAPNASATNGLAIQFSPDNTTWFTSDTYTIAANTCKTYSVQPVGPYFRVVYTNNGVVQTSFYLCTQFRYVSTKSSSHRMGDDISGEDDAELVKAILAAERPGNAGVYTNIQATNGGNLKVSLEEIESGVYANAQIYGSTSATGTPIAVPLDPATNTVQIIEYEHHEIHGGSSYRAGTAQDVGNAGVINLCITTPDTSKWSHLRPTVECEAECTEIFYENPTSISGGTGVLPKNANRNSTNVATSTCVFNATTNTTGATTLGTRTLGAGKTFGGSASSEFEWILKQNEQYILQVTNNTTGNNNIFIGFQWYEHTNKN